jgi:hypothetical protein
MGRCAGIDIRGVTPPVGVKFSFFLDQQERDVFIEGKKE